MLQKNLIYLILTFFVFSINFAQERKAVQGKIVSKSRDLEGVYIENITSRKSTTTEKGGYFKIEMQPNDTLIFASVNLIGIKRIINDNDMNKKIIFVPMEMSTNFLDELIIDRRITTESLGLSPKKKYTPAEKRLYTATSSSGGIIAIDAIVNALSGRTAMLKKALEYEREEILVNKIINTFDETFFVDELKIPKDYIQGFGYFLAQDVNVIAALNTTNLRQLKFMLTEKAIEYNNIIKVLQ